MNKNLLEAIKMNSEEFKEFKFELKYSNEISNLKGQDMVMCRKIDLGLQASPL